MYSSLYQGLVDDSRWMMLPIDDHMVHRGDGVFEAIKVTNGNAYLFNEHMARLETSAQKLGIPLYQSLEAMKMLVAQTVAYALQKSKQNQALLRIFLSRGPGSFSTNPYETTGSQFYVIATKLIPVSEEKYQKGVTVRRSQIPVKPSWLATVKSCNYLPNVMLKKEALDFKVDFTVAYDPNSFLAESSTENMVIVSKDGHLLKPKGDFILRGCTMTRVFELATKLLGVEKTLKGIDSRDISEVEVREAREIMMLGTTLDVLPVTQYENKPVGDGKPGPIAQSLLKMLLKDQRSF
jgi:branched-chain amino acid aminotransferase